MTTDGLPIQVPVRGASTLLWCMHSHSRADHRLLAQGRNQALCITQSLVPHGTMRQPDGASNKGPQCMLNAYFCSAWRGSQHPAHPAYYHPVQESTGRVQHKVQWVVVAGNWWASGSFDAMVVRLCRGVLASGCHTRRTGCHNELLRAKQWL